jgi:fucokinase
VRNSINDAVTAAINGSIDESCMSLKESFEKADTGSINQWQIHIRDKVQAYNFLVAIKQRMPVSETVEMFFKNGISKDAIRLILEAAKTADFSERIRIYSYLTFLADEAEKDEMYDKCFKTICDSILDAALDDIAFDDTLKIVKKHVNVQLPLRVNFGGGWSDTPPFCLEHGGTVLNTAVKINNSFPAQAVFERIDDDVIIFASIDENSTRIYTTLDELQRCSDPYDTHTLHKAVLIACGIIPYSTHKQSGSLHDILRRLEGSS